MTSPIRQSGTGHRVYNVTFPVATIVDKVLFGWLTRREQETGIVPGWMALGSQVHPAGTSDSGRWYYGTSQGSSVQQVSAYTETNMVVYETTIDAALFDPADVVLYTTDGHAASTDLNLGAVTAPTPGQLILYGAVYKHDAGGMISGPGAGWSVDYNIHTTDPNGHPYLLGMRWDETTTPLTGSATAASSAYAGVMLQLTPVPPVPLPNCSPLMID
jgi:hypothetical protein